MNVIQSTDTQRIYEYIHTHPGCKLKDILTIFPPDVNPRTVTGLVHKLRQGKAVVNKGGASSSARWHATDTQVDQFYLGIANDLLSELRTVHPIIREVYFARRLEEIFE